MARVSKMTGLMLAFVMILAMIPFFMNTDKVFAATSKDWMATYNFMSQKIETGDSAIKYQYQNKSGDTAWKDMTFVADQGYSSAGGAKFYQAPWDATQLVLQNSETENIAISFTVPVAGKLKWNWFQLGAYGDPNTATDFAMKVMKNDTPVTYTDNQTGKTVDAEGWTQYTSAAPFPTITVDPIFNETPLNAGDIVRVMFNGGATFEEDMDNKIFYNLQPFYFFYTAESPVESADKNDDLTPEEPDPGEVDPDTLLEFSDKATRYKTSEIFVNTFCKPSSLEEQEFDAFAEFIDDGPMVWQWAYADNMATQDSGNDLTFNPQFMDRVSYAGQNGELNGLRYSVPADQGWYFESNRISYVPNYFYDNVISLISPNSGTATVLFDPVNDGTAVNVDFALWQGSVDGVRIQVLLNGKPVEWTNVPDGFVAPDSDEEYAKGYLYLNPKSENSAAKSIPGTAYQVYKYLPAIQIGNVYKGDMISVRVSGGLAGNADNDGYVMDPVFVIDGDGVEERPEEPDGGNQGGGNQGGNNQGGDQKDDDKGGLGAGAIVGICAAAAVVVGGIVTTVVILKRKSKKQ